MRRGELRSALPLLALALLARCGTRGNPAASATATATAPTPAASDGPGTSPHSGTLALSPDERFAWVVEPDADRVAVVDLAARRLAASVALGPRPVADAQGTYAPAVAPRALSLAPRRGLAYVACERSGELVALDLATRAVRARRRVCARPVAALVTRDERAVLVSCAADDVVLALEPDTLAEGSRLAVATLPWALALARDEDTAVTAYVTQLHGPTVTALALGQGASGLDRVANRALPENPPRAHRTLAHGVPRSAYDLAVHPRTGAVWVAHELHAPDTAQPELDFESTVFPAVSVLPRDEAAEREPARTLTTDSRRANRPGVRDGEFYDAVSGPRALAFTPDGRFALVVAQASEDLLVIDTQRLVQAGIVRPLPGDWPQGVVLSRDGSRAYVELRNSGTLVTLRLAPSARALEGLLAEGAEEAPAPGLDVRVEGEPVRTRDDDPMPAELRAGQRVFFSANDAELPVTTNRWVACASCHPEGTTNRVTWRFSQGPRDTPTNAGGPDGFLFRTGDRRDVTEYWRTIVLEQGGHVRPDDELFAPHLRALSAFVRLGIPAPPPPTLDEASVARGRAVFERADTQCATCHPGPRGTDSGAGNPTLDLRGPVLLHDVGTCHPDDRAHSDTQGHPRAACAFDTPSLLGLHESAPYLHDGSAGTLREVLTERNARGQHGRTAQLTARELDDLVAYLRSR